MDTGLDLLLSGVRGGDTAGIPVPPKKVKGSVAHIDGDFIAYIVSADRKDAEQTTTEQAIKHLHEFIENIVEYSGAEDYLIHLSNGKSGRTEQALQKEYQANRDGRDRPILLGFIRDYIAESTNSTFVPGMEADDTIAHYMFKEQREGKRPVCVSQDKDLQMIPGHHFDWKTLKNKVVSFEGKLVLEERVSAGGNKSKKLRGEGGLWFAAQLLRGDTADNVAGLPKVHPAILNEIDPTKATAAAIETIKTATDATKIEKALNVLRARTPKPCGDVLVYKMLEGKTLKDALQFVMVAYRLYGCYYGFQDYNGNPISSAEALKSECQLLYMRHNLGDYDYLEFMEAALNGRGAESYSEPGTKAQSV